MTYTVERTNKEVYNHCEKHKLKLVDDSDGSEVIEQRVSFSNWQLNDDSYKDRVKQWADKRVKADLDREKDISLNFEI